MSESRVKLHRALNRSLLFHYLKHNIYVLASPKKVPAVFFFQCISGGGGECDDNMFQIVWRAYLLWIPQENKTREEQGGK